VVLEEVFLTFSVCAARITMSASAKQFQADVQAFLKQHDGQYDVIEVAGKDGAVISKIKCKLTQHEMRPSLAELKVTSYLIRACGTSRPSIKTTLDRHTGVGRSTSKPKRRLIGPVIPSTWTSTLRTSWPTRVTTDCCIVELRKPCCITTLQR